MRWLIALGLAVAACSGSGSEGSSSPKGEAGEAGEAYGGTGAKPSAAGASSSAGVSARAGEGGSAEAGAHAGAGESGAGTAGGAGGAEPDPQAGQGGELVVAGGPGEGGSASGAPPVGTSGTGGTITKPDPCEGVLPWDPAVPYTKLEKDELRTLRGELWKCSSPAFCTTHPGHETAPGWQKVDDCSDPNEGGEPACQCEEGACCDGCYFRPRAHFCGEVVRTVECANSPVANCGGMKEATWSDYWNLFCGGDTGGDCTRWGAHTRYELDQCESSSGCKASGDQASCVDCPG
jgi:hypothetical protein